MITNILLSISFFTCGALCGMLFDSYMWVKNYKKNKKEVILLFEEKSHEV